MKDKNKLVIVLVIIMSAVTLCTLIGFGMIRFMYFGSPLPPVPLLGSINSAATGLFNPQYIEPPVYTGTTSTATTLPEPDTFDPTDPGSYMKMRDCSASELFSENVRLNIADKDRTKLENIRMFEDGNPYGVNVVFWNVAGKESESVLLVYPSERCKYEILLNDVAVYNVTAVYFSVDEKRIYILKHIYEPSGDEKRSILNLIKYDPVMQVVEKTTELILPFHTSTFGYNDYIAAESKDEYIFLNQTVLDVTNSKLFFSTTYFNGCFSDYKCRFIDSEKDYANAENQRVTGVFEVDLNSKVMKKVYNPALLNQEGVLLKTRIEKLIKYNKETNEYTYEVYYVDTREKATAP